jgi:hypothetical protein
MKETTIGPEHTTEGDIFFNYALWPYKPAVPHANKFRSLNLLLHSFETAGGDERLLQLVGMIREKVGTSNTVWGVKHTGEGMKWELYFYDYARSRRQRSISLVLDAIKPLVSSPINPNEGLLYFMFSLDIDNGLVRRERDLEELHMYIGNPGSSVSSGICYALSPAGSRLENFYFFFDARTQLDDVFAKVACSAHVDMTRIGIDSIVVPELRDCRTICVANKQKNDCIYFAGITIDQFISFLRRLNYPGETVSFVEKNRSMLDHLEYDVGFDYRMDGSGLKILKSGYYGIF